MVENARVYSNFGADSEIIRKLCWLPRLEITAAFANGGCHVLDCEDAIEASFPLLTRERRIDHVFPPPEHSVWDMMFPKWTRKRHSRNCRLCRGFQGYEIPRWG